MDILLTIIGVIFFIGFVVGIWQGAIKIAVSLLTTAITIAIVFFVTPYVVHTMTQVTPIEEVVEHRMESMLQDMVVGGAEEQMVQGGDVDQIRSTLKAAGISEDMLASKGVTVEDIADGRVSKDDLAELGISRNILDGLQNQEEEPVEVEEVDIPRDQQIELIESADIPNLFKDLLLTNNNSEIYNKLEVTTFGEYVCAYLAKVVVNIIAFLFTLLVVTILLRAIIFALNVVSDLPVFGFVNRFAGGVLGLGASLVIVWVIFVVITLLYTTDAGKELFDMIQKNEILATIYEINPILKIATILRG